MSEYDRRLRRLVDQAFDLKGTPYFRDACEAIVELHDQRVRIAVEAGEEALAQLDPFVLECLLGIRA